MEGKKNSSSVAEVRRTFSMAHRELRFFFNGSQGIPLHVYWWHLDGTVMGMGIGISHSSKGNIVS
jgi:hypothetical protein